MDETSDLKEARGDGIMNGGSSAWTCALGWVWVGSSRTGMMRDVVMHMMDDER